MAGTRTKREENVLLRISRERRARGWLARVLTPCILLLLRSLLLRPYIFSNFVGLFRALGGFCRLLEAMCRRELLRRVFIYKHRVWASLVLMERCAGGIDETLEDGNDEIVIYSWVNVLSAVSFTLGFSEMNKK